MESTQHMYSSKKRHNKKEPILPKSNNKKLTEDQLRLLEASFNLERKLDTDRKFHLAQELGIPAKQVAIWYQNKRARWKSQSLETGYKTLQQKLDNALLENERLKQELEKAHQVLKASTNYSSSTSYACDEEGSSDLIIGEPNSCILQSELYAYLIGSDER